ncbi:MAG: tetratricopeptide repeat protein [Elusimicrobia bacterium]|nr:tetratricopeptide repeat protein [Elusimicrobiota bacterium]
MAESPYVEVESHLTAGRVKEAASALKRMAAAGAAPWEIFQWMGRIEERRGCPGQAEGFYRKAMREDARGAPELYRLLEEGGRLDEAREVMAEAASRALAGPAAGLFALLEFSDFRRALAERAAAAGVLDRVEEAARSALSGAAPAPGARSLLVEVLLTRGRREDAGAELAASFRAARRDDESSRIDLLFRLLSEGRYDPDLERAVLDGVARAGPGDKLAVDWPQVFSALMCARRHAAAFRLGEAVLDKFGRFESPGQLMWPWWRMIRRAVAEDSFVSEELRLMGEEERGGEFPEWFAYYRAILLCARALNAEAMQVYAKLRSLDSGRYSWMWQSFVLVKLGALDFDGAIEISRDILSRAPSHWWVRCRMAEAYMARGDTATGLGEFDLALETCGPGLEGEVLTWHGEVLLWLGEYERALEKLDAAVARGAETFVFGWRGAALLKLGRLGEALADLDRAVAHDPKDFEALAWRAEAYRVMGRPAEAMRDIEAVVKRGPRSFWAHFNRGLLRDALGDEAGMAEDVSVASQKMLDFLMTRLGIPFTREGMTREQMRRLMASGLEWAKGIRRWENYVQPIWMNRPT